MPQFLTGSCLVSPQSHTADYFSGAVICLVHHDGEGAVGLMINRTVPVHMGRVFNDLHIPLRQSIDLPLLEGGPMLRERGLVMHTGQPLWHSSAPITENICVTSSRDILYAIADGKGVSHYQMVLGHAGWEKGQLEQELRRGDWLVCEANSELVFKLPVVERWRYALRHAKPHSFRKTPKKLKPEIGHA